jgi:hypothetical protein
MEVAITQEVQEAVDMHYAYFLLVPISVGGIALFLTGRKLWLKIMGLFLFGAALFGLLLIPAILRQAS